MRFWYRCQINHVPIVKKIPKLERPTRSNAAAIGIVDDQGFLKPVSTVKKLILPTFIHSKRNTEKKEKIQKEITNGKNPEMARIFAF